jgi:Gpi18-like mannosyltransferase
VHYLNIATLGYAADLNNTIWPPLYPGLIWLVSRVIPDPLMAALILSNLACWLGFFLLYRLVDGEWSQTVARQSIYLMCIFPTAFFLLAGYTESLFLALAVGAMWMARRRMWFWSGVLTALTALTRLQGVFLVIPVAWEIWVAFRDQEEPFRKTLVGLIALCLPVFALGVYYAEIHFGIGAPFPWQSITAGWEEVFGWPWQGILGNGQALWQGITGGQIPFGTTLYDLVIALLVIGLIIVGWRRIPISYSLYSAAVFLPSLMKVTTGNLLVSITRYAIVLFPVFIVLAMVLKRKISNLVWFGICVGSQALFLAVFYLAFWVG